MTVQSRHCVYYMYVHCVYYMYAKCQSYMQLQTSSKTDTSVDSLQTFLERSSRKLHRALPDGNCLFRSVAHQLCGSQEFIRLLIQCFENLNKAKFSPFLMDVNSLLMSILRSLEGRTQGVLILRSCNCHPVRNFSIYYQEISDWKLLLGSLASQPLHREGAGWRD